MSAGCIAGYYSLKPAPLRFFDQFFRIGGELLDISKLFYVKLLGLDCNELLASFS